MRVSCTSSATRTAGWARWNSQRSRGTTTAAGPGRGAERERAREVALALRGDVVEHLLLEREQTLRAAVEPRAGLGRLDPAPRAVEELRAETLLERAHLERDRRLGDAELLRRLRERPPLDDRAECRQLARVHKRMLIDAWCASPLRCMRTCRRGDPMRIWIDVTNSPHVVFFRPVVELLEARGHDVAITARDFAQTLELLEDAGLEHTVLGPPHGGASRAGKARAMALAPARPAAVRARSRRSTSHSPTRRTSCRWPRARSAIPSSYAFDYEFARVQHGLGCRARPGSSSRR